MAQKFVMSIVCLLKILTNVKIYGQQIYVAVECRVKCNCDLSRAHPGLAIMWLWRTVGFSFQVGRYFSLHTFVRTYNTKSELCAEQFRTQICICIISMLLLFVLINYPAVSILKINYSFYVHRCDFSELLFVPKSNKILKKHVFCQK